MHSLRSGDQEVDTIVLSRVDVNEVGTGHAGSYGRCHFQKLRREVTGELHDDFQTSS